MKNPLRRGDKDEPAETGDMTLIGHLSELRTRLIRSVLAIVVGAIVVYIFNRPIFDFLRSPAVSTSTVWSPPACRA